MQKTLHLNVKKKWFDLILVGVKTEEYREAKLYWFKRLMGPVWLNEYDTITFKNGYQKNARFMIVEFKGIDIGPAKPEWSDNWQGDLFRIKLGKIIEYDSK